jgi:predicted nucleic acid-binding protein
MKTALDTNVLIALWDTSSGMQATVIAACMQLRKSAPIIVCGPVFSELQGFPGRTAIEILDRLGAEEISIEWDFSRLDWQTAGLAYQGYVVRRRSSGSGLPRRMMTDFLIGAHATVRSYRLLTLDNRLYSAAFPGLRITEL